MDTVYFDLPLIEWIGYLASTLVLISLSLSSIVKLRIFNLIGAAIFSFYGFYINALPVGIMNLVICIFNIYYLRSLLLRKEMFDGVWVKDSDEYLHLFLNHYQKDIRRFFPGFKTDQVKGCQILMAVRDMNVAGVMLLSENKEGESNVLLDYVTPQYRDYKTGKYLLRKFKTDLIEKGIHRLTTHSANAMHIKYLKRIGFESSGTSYQLDLCK
ncbi:MULTISPECIES: GNAT family N-acetyltransferase [unclassified Carboxylicivirga]|uniref:GNAT family N-acetyltransferase n=1 Tax=Carboxylicivirga TaxID=1628153 RepID=UPI003D34329D